MAFMFRLKHGDGTPADPPALKSAVPDWRPGDTIALGRGGCSASLKLGSRKRHRRRPVQVLVVEDLP